MRTGCWLSWLTTWWRPVWSNGRLRTDSTHVLAAVRKLNRVELVTETLRAALEALAAANDTWLAPMVTAGWVERYGRPARYDRPPRTKSELDAHVLQVGEDGIQLLAAVYRSDAPPRLSVLSQVPVLRQVWIQQYWRDADGKLAWRGPENLNDRVKPPA